MKINREGSYRIVFELKDYVIKIPNFLDGWRIFLKGLISNLNEQHLYMSIKSPYLCPIIFYISGGWLIIMPKARAMDRATFIKNIGLISKICGEFESQIEEKENSFGLLTSPLIHDRIVAIDYGGK